MDSSLIDVECERGIIGAPMSFSLPQVFQSCPPDTSVTVSLNASAGQHQQQQLQQQPPYPQQPLGHLHKTPLQLAPQYGTARSPSKEGDVRIEGWSNSGSSGVQPNVPVSAAQTTEEASGAVTSADALVAASHVPQPDALHRNPIVSVTASESPAAAAPEKEESSERVHVLVVFDKVFCVCFVPSALRATLKVGELVLCEYTHGENIGTIVADVSTLVAKVMQQHQSTMSLAAVEQAFTPPCERVVRTAGTPVSSVVEGHSSGLFVATTAMCTEKAHSGLPADQRLRRLPCVLRRGTNRDKKRMYFARLRSNDALAAVLRVLRSEPLVAQSAEYQVNFACVTIYLGGERSQCGWSAHQFQQLGNTLVDPLRSETVEFRFVCDQHHEELDLTRAITGLGLSEILYAVVADHHKRQSGKGGQGSRGGAAHGAAVNRPGPLIQHSQQQQQAGQLFGGQSSTVTTYTSSSMWPQSATALTPRSCVTPASQQQQRQQKHAMGYTLAPCVYVPQQQQQQTTNVHTITLPSHAVTNTQPATQSLSLLQVHYPPISQVNPAPGIYWANVSTQPQPQRLEAPQQQQQQQLSIAHSGVSEPAYYYVVSSSQQQQQSVAPQPSSAPQRGPTLLQARALAAPPHVHPPTFVEVPVMNTEGYQAVSYPFVLPSSTTPYS
ncbi:conserved hypothetical protein [Leishmania infantum JPCM5]|uniref:Uncharacterized protein n=2 Tax=Leishmania infantum TaxID=5671 RepID=A4IDW2_LEIIN|nr:conserved hypothetical protein [Leishmania infantum JPCM5]CAC9552532.1 hypothetical_protein_-_conserved [Leishmania infantum]CAM73047.1 conserved hypothetical protein [Leishmania infantum JPCM5]SUZ46953.1 hypothetical_protein_-_conserved [Leishmania infantum]|eukprot:XP_001469931.1 conserved hypothetical protein [Leishmania infantum JPCM5]